LPKLWLFGDSFGSVDVKDCTARQWPLQLSHKLGYDLKNFSLAGSSQDYTWFQIHQNVDSIQPEDRLVVIMTSPNRVWLFDRYPNITNPQHIANVIEPYQRKVWETYFKHIQRDSIDTMNVKNRLGWLNHMSTIHHWARPLIVFAFEQDYGNSTDYPGLEFSQGNLAEDVQIKEFTDPKDILLLRGADPRYNHMCLSNHDRLVDKLANTILNQGPLDLVNGFLQSILNTDSLKNNKLVEAELSPLEYKRYLDTFANPHWDNFVQTLRI
jgi:hypothetical protein